VFGENAGTLARIVAFVLPLGLDTLGISIALGLQGQRPLRPALVFVAFETAMPLIGIVIGRVAGLWFEALAAYLGGLILLAAGFHTIREARYRGSEVQRFALNSLRGTILKRPEWKPVCRLPASQDLRRALRSFCLAAT